MLGCHFLLWSELCRNRAGYVFRCVALATHFFLEEMCIRDSLKGALPVGIAGIGRGFGARTVELYEPKELFIAHVVHFLHYV